MSVHVIPVPAQEGYNVIGIRDGDRSGIFLQGFVTENELLELRDIINATVLLSESEYPS